MTSTTWPRHTLSKSDFKLARTCPAKLYYREMGYPDTRSDDPYLAMLARGGYMVEMIAKLEHPEGVALDYGRDHEAAAQETLALLRAGDVTLFEATLVHENCLARVDVLRRRGRVLDLFEVKASLLDEADAEDRLEKTGSRFRSLKRDKATGLFPLSNDWLEYLEDVTYQVLILRRLFPDAEIRPHLVLIRSQYRATVDALPSWFKVEERQGSDGRTRLHSVRFTGDATAIRANPMTIAVAVADEVAELLPSVERYADQFAASLSPAPRRLEAPLTRACRDCEFNPKGPEQASGFRDCWGERAAVRPSVLELAKGDARVDQFIAEGITSLLDVPLDRLGKKNGELGAIGERQHIQITHSRDGTEWKHPALGLALRHARYPLHFIDFEVATTAIPHHQGMKSYGRLAFQWSCHTLAEPGAPLVHREWINSDRLWPNAEFARSLRQAVGEEGTILTWSHFEESVLRSIGGELAEFEIDDPELGDWLLRIAGTSEAPSDRVLDLHKLCAAYYFHPGMGGRTSIKAVLDALWSASPTMRRRFADLEGREGDPALGPYAALPPVVINGVQQAVAEGTGAIRAYEAMTYGVERTDEAVKAGWRDLLRQYCRLDTLAMVLIWEHWMAGTA